MKTLIHSRRTVVLAVVLAFISLPCLAAPEPLPPMDAYVGSVTCKKCHEDKYDGWKKTFHSTAVQNARENPAAILGDFSKAGIGFQKKDVEYTVGAHWNQRYMKKIGDEYYILPKLWSIPSQKWEPHNVWGWRKMPYSRFCVGCHATRYDPSDRSYVEHTIGCENCHGPGRAHVDGGGDTSKIVHPAKLGGVEMEMICASCHVRGKDPSGEYHFPVGFVPGRPLADYYIPSNMEPGETLNDAFLRLFRKWWSNAGSADAECEVCGIYGDKQEKAPKTVTEYCMSCHKYGEKYPAHTHHEASVSLECADCHKKVSVEYEEEDDEDVHSVSYFLVHKKTCYNKDFTDACRSCHQGFTADIVKATVDTWNGRQSIHE